MKRSWFSILLVLVLFGLLGLLATLQYRWVGQISENDRETMQKRLQMDTDRFADDFNNEIRNAFYNFQVDASDFKQKNWTDFNDKFDYWKTKSAYPGLIAEFYFIDLDGDSLKYDQANKSFDPSPLPAEFADISDKLKKPDSFPAIDENIPALVMPVYDNKEFLVAKSQNQMEGSPRKRAGVLILKLDPKVIEEQILPALTKEYFPDDEGANYRLSIISQNDNEHVIYRNHPEETSATSDSSARLFSLAPEKMAFFINRDLASSLSKNPEKASAAHSNVVLTQRFESRTTTKTIKPPVQEKTFSFKVLDDKEKPRVTVMESSDQNPDGVWVLNVQHRAGSLDNFIANTRNKNLAVSFGILSLLGISVGLIFLSAQRAKKLAQRQMDFVSSVSHEFRTPLAVIYSAGENLTDGVVNSHNQVTEYGTLIKHEGKKLSTMVEQILEFAGARSGKRKYDLRKTDVALVLAGALAECRPLIDEKGVAVEQNIQPGLPQITADAAALDHAFQNLISNAVKYGGEGKRLKITAENGGGAIKLSFEDNGIGIPPRERSQIFEPFYRGKEVVAAQIHGNGLGLSLVKQIVEAHNGRIDVESRPGEGSKFTIKLPL